MSSAPTSPGRVAGKVALITGGARGQGASHGQLLAREGARVLLADVLDAEGEALAQSLQQQNLDVGYCHLDVSDDGQWRNAVELAEERFGPVTVLVNNAGIGGKASVSECSNEEWDRVIAVNQTGVFYGMRAVIPAMKRAGNGSIINISSQIGHTGGFEGELVAYVAAKTAVLGLTRNAALTLGPYGIRANSISPGMIDTALLGDPVRNQPFVERVPLRRVAQPLEVSHAVVYLASDESSYVTGADLMIDGGLETL
jgi:3alpha(or 20beta)-hydroxysteroid dehydrogenase